MITTRGTVNSQLFVWNVNTLSWVAWDGDSPAVGGTSVYRVLWPANTTGVNIKNAPGHLHGWFISNVAAAPRFVKLYDKSTAPSVGSDTPKLTLLIPAQGSANLGVAANLLNGMGVAFTSGLGIGITTAVADNDTTAPTANDVIVNLFYI